MVDDVGLGRPLDHVALAGVRGDDVADPRWHARLHGQPHAAERVADPLQTVAKWVEANWSDGDVWDTKIEMV